MSKYLVALGVVGCASIALGVNKMFSVSMPDELKDTKYPLKAKEAIVRCLLSHDIKDQLELIEKAKMVCARRYGHVSPQYNRLACWKARLVGERGECEEVRKTCLEMIKKPHVGEAVVEEVRRWQSAEQLYRILATRCGAERDDNIEAEGSFLQAKSRLPDYIRQNIDPVQK
jgi:hypothetical protein